MTFFLYHDQKRIFRILSFIFTGLNGLAGLLGIYFAIIGDIFWPLRLIIIGAGFDFLDGFFARKTEQHSNIGVYMDSFADAITYILVPSFILIFIKQNGQLEFIIPIALVYIVCGCYRLIRFVRHQTGVYFEGLPASIAALIIGSLNVLISASPPELTFLLNKGIHIGFIVICISLLMITHLKYPSHVSYSTFYKIFRGIGYITILMFVFLSNFWTGLGVFLFFLFYTLAGPYYMRTMKLNL
ncbi:MAG: CDP-alcohol phosphatidyltransferase family protein [Promethearchaeota archaeon]